MTSVSVSISPDPNTDLHLSEQKAGCRLQCLQEMVAGC